MGRSFRRGMVRAVLVAAVAPLFHSTIAQASTSWSAPVSGLWTDGTKWSSGVPDSLTNVIIGAETLNQDFYAITLRSPVSANLIQMNTHGGAIAIQGNSDYGNALLTVSNGFTLTNGFLGLQSTDGPWNSDLNVSGGGMTIGSGGSMFLTRGTWGGVRQVTGSITNQGFIYSDSAAQYNNGTLTNSGSVQVDAFGQFIVNSTSTFRNLAGGTVSANALGQFVVNGGTFDWAGGTVSGPIYMAGGNPTLKTSVSGLNNNSFGSIFHFRTSGHLAGDLSAGAFASVEANSDIGNVLLDVDAGATNRGRIQLEAFNGGYGSFLRIQSGTFTNAGQLWITTGSSGGARSVTGNLTNTGEMLLSSSTDFNGNVRNSGTFNINAGNTSVNSKTFIQEGGTLSINQNTGGFMIVNNGTFLYLGGKVAGEVELRDNSYLATSVIDGGGAKFLVSRAGVSLNGGMATNSTIRVMGNGAVGNVYIQSLGDGGNYGTINLESANSGWESNLKVESGKTLTNYGSILLSPGSGGVRRLTGVIDNEYAIFDTTAPGPGYSTYIEGQVSNYNLYYIGANTTTRVGSNSTFHQGGFQLSMEPGAKMLIDGGTFSYGGGSITGGGEINLYGAHLRTTLANGSGAVFNVVNDSRMESNLSPNTHVNVIGNGTYGNTNFSVLNGSQLRGIIHLTSQSAGWTSQLLIPNDSGTANTGTATNSGMILFETGTGGLRYLQGSITNKGTVQADISADIFGNFYNQVNGTFRIADNQTVTVHQVGLAPTVFSQEGGTLIVGKNAHLTMSNASFIFDSGTLTLGSSMIAKSASVPTGSSISVAGLAGGLTVSDPTGISIPGGSIISTDGASIVAQGGGNIVAQGAGNIVAQGGGNIVAQGGGNITAISLAQLISQDGGGLIGNAIVAQGGGNIVAQGAGNIVAQGAGNIVAQGGGNALPLAMPASLNTFNHLVAPTANPGDIFLDSSTFTIDSSTASATASTRLLNHSLLTGNGTITATSFDVDDTSTISATGGTLHLLGAVSAYNNGSLTTGHWQVHANSTLHAPGIGSIVTNAADITLDGVGSTWSSTDTITNNLGRFAITGGRKFVSTGSFTNSGTVLIGAGSALKTAPALLNGGTIDLNGALIVDYAADQVSPLANLRAQLGNHIFSSISAGDSLKRIGYAEAGTLGVNSFGGLDVDSSSALLELTYAGDANLDGKVDIRDLFQLAKSWHSNGADWFGGDFTYDGVVNAADLGLLAANWQAGNQSATGGASLSSTLASLGLPEVAVPEPSAVTLISLSLARLIKRRKRTNR